MKLDRAVEEGNPYIQSIALTPLKDDDFYHGNCYYSGWAPKDGGGGRYSLFQSIMKKLEIPLQDGQIRYIQSIALTPLKDDDFYLGNCYYSASINTKVY